MIPGPFSITLSDNRYHPRASLRQFAERLPFELLGMDQGSTLRLRFALWRDDLPVDSLPLEGWIELHAMAEEELETIIRKISARVTDR